MKAGQRLWTREELILAINLYCKLPFSKYHKGNPEVIALSKLINRTPSSVALKLGNLASFDPSLKARGISGASNASKLDKEVWNEFYNNWDEVALESEILLAQKMEQTELKKLDIDWTSKKGESRESVVHTRINQSFFRSAVLTSYNFQCCITGLNQPDLLIAGHIKPWSVDNKNRLNPRNGLSLNGLHDKAFELGYITITPNYRIKISPILLKRQSEESVETLFVKYDGKEIILPSRFLPDPEFLEYHNNERFKP